jgi:hypothetical protein
VCLVNTVMNLIFCKGECVAHGMLSDSMTLLHVKSYIAENEMDDFHDGMCGYVFKGNFRIFSSL